MFGQIESYLLEGEAVRHAEKESSKCGRQSRIWGVLHRIVGKAFWRFRLHLQLVLSQRIHRLGPLSCKACVRTTCLKIAAWCRAFVLAISWPILLLMVAFCSERTYGSSGSRPYREKNENLLHRKETELHRAHGQRAPTVLSRKNLPDLPVRSVSWGPLVGAYEGRSESNEMRRNHWTDLLEIITRFCLTHYYF